MVIKRFELAENLSWALATVDKGRVLQWKVYREGQMPDFNVLGSYIMFYSPLGTQYSGPLIPSHELEMWDTGKGKVLR